MAQNEMKKELGSLDFPSTEILDVEVEDKGGDLRIRFTRERDDGTLVEGGALFEGVRAYRHRAESHCTVWHIEAYDRLMEVENSEWIAELLAAMPPDLRGLFVMHHYVTYLDSSGCYEAVAASGSFVPEVPIDGE